MNAENAAEMLKTIAAVMNEDSSPADGEAPRKKQKAASLYNEMREAISGRGNPDGVSLLESLSPISYENKFHVLERANHLADTIGLYINYPELINKRAVAFYDPGKNQKKSICKKYLKSMKDAIETENPDFLSENVPTILTSGAEMVHALNLAQKSLFLSAAEYGSLDGGASQPADLSGILYAYSMGSEQIPKDWALVLLPGHEDKTQPYYRLLLEAADVFVVPGKLIGDKVVLDLLTQGNLHRVVVTGIYEEQGLQRLKSLAEPLHIEIRCENTADGIYESAFASLGTEPSGNFCNRLLMESCLCEVLWALAEQREALGNRMGEINRSLLADEKDAVKSFLKGLQAENQKKMENWDTVSGRYYAAMQRILEKIDALQRLYGVNENIQSNRHVRMADRLLEILAAEGAYLKFRRTAAASDHLRQIEALANSEIGSPVPARVLMNVFFTAKNTPSDLQAFENHKTKSALLLHRQVSAWVERNPEKEWVSDCAEKIWKIDGPLTPLEHRILGLAYTERADQANAEAEWRLALEGGDLTSGDFLYIRFSPYRGPQSEKLTYLAEHGVKAAAYQMGEELYRQWESLNPIYKASENTARAEKAARDKMFKYLHIAAAQGDQKAYKLLGDIWCRDCMEAPDRKKNERSWALKYYQLAEKAGANGKELWEQIGSLYYQNKNYRDAQTYLEKAATGGAFFSLAKMHENGEGVAKDREKALTYYEKAAAKGHAQAQVEYDKLSAALAEEKKKAEAAANTSYSGSSYYSGYYTSYSGW